MLANEDTWLEYQDIDFGAWANKNLRAMSEEVGAKDVYDRYYDWPSSQWMFRLRYSGHLSPRDGSASSRSPG